MGTRAVVTVNAGSSSIKSAVFTLRPGEEPEALISMLFEGIGVRPHFLVRDSWGRPIWQRSWEEAAADAPADHAAALAIIAHYVNESLGDLEVAAIGHRVVHGGASHAAPVVIDPALRAVLAELVSLAPLHQPHNIAGIDAMAQLYPGVPQVACFDTGFHRGHSFEAEAYALPRRYYEAGIRRYGFHGLSYEYIAARLRQIAPDIAAGRVVVAHLGNGASMCAIREGRSIDSSMGFTAADGLPMGTRTGQIDPGVLIHLMTSEGKDAAALTRLIYNESGLKGLSGISSDMRDLESSAEPAAHEAIACFVYRIRRELGALAAALGGLDALVFTAGIGENARGVRAAVCAGMDWLGITLDAEANQRNRRVISAPGAPVRVMVVPTSEEAMIAIHACALAG